MTDQELINEQRSVCEKFGAGFVEAAPELKLGIAESVKSGAQPINGLRHPQAGGTTGWYIWAGEEFPTAPDAFKPVHVEHMDEWNASVKKYLGLAPGWRFQIDDKGHEDVWEDKSLLDPR